MPNNPKLMTRSFVFKQRFLPLFWVQFLSAFNDNFYKNAMVILIAFQLNLSNEQIGLYITLAAGLFILPFFLFSAVAGQLADHFAKSTLIRYIKIAEIPIMALGVIGFLTMQMEWLFTALFLMGSQSAFFGPIKYSVLPEVLESDDLLRGNALFSGSTFIAILLGTIGGGLLIMLDNGAQIVSASVILFAVLGYLVSRFVPNTEKSSKKVTISFNIFRSTWQVVKRSTGHKEAFFASWAISWFWFIGAVLLSQIPSFVKVTLHANEQVVVAFLTIFSIGIAMGAWLMSLFCKRTVTLRFHPRLLVSMSLFLLLTVWAANAMVIASPVSALESRNLLDLTSFLTLWPQSLSLLFMFALAIAGGAYIVPLYTQLQTKTPQTSRARIVAVNNILNAFLMVLSSILIMVGFSFELSLPAMLLILALFNLFIAGWFARNARSYNEVVV